MAETTFFLFSQLPTELRRLIWREALPKYTGPSLFFFKRECWWLDPESMVPETGDLEMRFFPGRLDDDVQLDVHIFNANHEARGVALDWFREQGINIKINENGQKIFSRSFNPQRDVLYITPERWDDFQRRGLGDIEGVPFVLKSEPERVAVSLDVFLRPINVGILPEVMW
ncbi:hypothetical protein GL218_04626 [Daldinia childiae]|uniref:uncharacterized protein n=1 Tax=Daldinia childiae TaxID=326645 RepID=UPI0014458CC3|nr:uncharacterized protein GL218_04626 [Daldinia childiae]KAF3059313.1 hypothetical protein GL218_04626 [Daldinia childiae]